MPRPDARGRRRLDAGTRREAIVAAARAAFAEEPYDDVSVAALAARAGTSEALVYHYFESKGRLYASVLQSELDELSARQLAADAALPAGTVDELLKPENEAKLKAILTYHVVAGKVMAARQAYGT